VFGTDLLVVFASLAVAVTMFDGLEVLLFLPVFFSLLIVGLSSLLTETPWLTAGTSLFFVTLSETEAEFSRAVVLTEVLAASLPQDARKTQTHASENTFKLILFFILYSPVLNLLILMIFLRFFNNTIAGDKAMPNINLVKL